MAGSECRFRDWRGGLGNVRQVSRPAGRMWDPSDGSANVRKDPGSFGWFREPPRECRNLRTVQRSSPAGPGTFGGINDPPEGSQTRKRVRHSIGRKREPSEGSANLRKVPGPSKGFAEPKKGFAEPFFESLNPFSGPARCRVYSNGSEEAFLSRPGSTSDRGPKATKSPWTAGGLPPLSPVGLPTVAGSQLDRSKLLSGRRRQAAAHDDAGLGAAVTHF